MPAFLERNEDWCRSVTATYRARKRETGECFKEELFYEPFALTLPGIFIWARCYHLHVAIFFNYGYWTSHYKHNLGKCNIFLLFRGNNVYDDTRMISAPEYKERYKEITCTARKITRYLAKHKEWLCKEVEEKTSSSSANITNDTDSNAQSPEKKDADEQSDIDLEDMLENSVEKSDREGNNVQKDVEPEELDEGTKTDNVQMDTEEHVIGEVTEGVDNNVQKSKPRTSEENETENNKEENDLEKLQNSTSNENQAEDEKQDDPLENEQPINAGNDMTEDKTGQHEEHNDNVEDMQVEEQSSNEDKNMQETQEDRKDNKVNNDKQDNIDEQMDADNVQKDSDKPERRISPCSTNASKTANKLIQNARSKIKGSWEFVNKQHAERAKVTKCFVCGKQNKTLQELELHVQRKHKSYCYKCTYCRKKYLT